MRLFDLHCDTAGKMYEQKQRFCKNGLHIDGQKAKKYTEYTQVFAIWTDPGYEDAESLERFFAVLEYAKNDPDFPKIITKRTELSSCGAVIGAEGANLLCGKLSNLDLLYNAGLRVLTLAWGGENALAGSHEIDKPLTAFGKTVVEKCFDAGIAVDVSHLCDSAFSTVADIARSYRLPFAASHSCFRSLCDIKRNITDEQAKTVAKLGGVVGVNLVGSHLTDEFAVRRATVRDVTKHILHGINTCGEEGIAIGCDFDGTSKLPDGINGTDDLEKLADALIKCGLSGSTVDRIFYSNAYRFMYEAIK